MNKGVSVESPSTWAVAAIAILMLLIGGCASTARSASQINLRLPYTSIPPKGWGLIQKTDTGEVWSPPGKRNQIVSFIANPVKGPGDPMNWDIRKAVGPDAVLESDTISLLCGRIQARYVVLEDTTKQQIVETVFRRVGNMYYDASYFRHTGLPVDVAARTAIMSMCPKRR
jgi:hypothetical protein